MELKVLKVALADVECFTNTIIKAKNRTWEFVKRRKGSLYYS